MFQFPGFACNPYEFRATYLLLITISPKPPSVHSASFLAASFLADRRVLGMIVIEGGFPHSEIRGSKLVRSSPRLIAAYHVLHRLSAPRHPPNTLKALDRSHYQCSSQGSEISRQQSGWSILPDFRLLTTESRQALTFERPACEIGPTAGGQAPPTCSACRMLLVRLEPEFLRTRSSGFRAQRRSDRSPLHDVR